MKSLPLISVVIPAYNHAQYIQAALQSVIDQDYPELEIIVVDDGSSDDTAAVAQKTLEQGMRPFRLIRQENTGAHVALNRGMQLAQGEYIAILNSDDRFLPGRLQILFNALTNANRRFAFSKIRHIDSSGLPHPYQNHYLRQVEEAKQFPTLSFELLRSNIAATTGNFFFHRSIFENVGDFAAYVTCHDWDYILRVMLVEEPLFVDEILLEYRIHEQGTLQTHLDKVNQEIEQLMLDFLTKVRTAKNSLAPGSLQWGDYWNFFCEMYLDRIKAFPRVRAQLETMGLEDMHTQNSEVPAPPIKSPPNVFGTTSFGVDLDLTQITLQSPTVLRDKQNHLHLLLVLPWMVMGGAERFTINMMDQLQQRGWKFSVVCTAPSNSGWQGEFTRRASETFILPDVLPVRSYARFLRYLIEQRDFDALLLQGSIEGYRLLPTLRTLFPHLPILDYLHFITPDWMNGGFPRLSYLYRDGLDLTITSCQQVKQWMIQEGAEENRLRVCPIGVDTQCWKPDSIGRARVRQSLGIGDDEVVLIYAARLEMQKQPMIFAETLRLLQEQGIEFHALVAGEGSLHAELERFIQQNRLGEKVNLLGAVASAEMPALLAAGDVFFLPSQNEGISSAVYEAMACGLPVVGADVGGQAELVTPPCGILISVLPEEKQPAVYANALKELIIDKTRRQKMGTAGRERILSNFTLDHMGDCISKVLAEVIHLKQEGKLAPPVLPSEERFLRETQHVVEYLQARQEWRSLNERHEDLMHKLADLSDKYFELLQPKPPSHWFYLWIRQLSLPIFERLLSSRLGKTSAGFQKWLKRKWIKE